MRTGEEMRHRRAADQRMDAVLAAIPDGIITFDDRGVVESANAAAERLFGYPADGLTGRSVRGLLSAPAGVADPWAVGEWRDAEAVRAGGGRLPVVVTVEAAGGAFVGIVRDATRDRDAADVADLVRFQISQDLHDNVGQQLTGLGLMADSLSYRLTGLDPAIVALADRVTEGVRRVNSALRELVTRSLPTDIPADGLVPALDGFAARVREQYGRPCEFGPAEPVRVADAATATHLFRIVQEAVSNAIRHSQARVIRLSVRQETDALVVEVRDDGRGFTPHPDRVGLGMKLMHDRATRIGGTLTTATTTAGTIVTVRVPTPV